MSEVELTPFDNDLSIAYKNANILNIPVRYLVIRNPEVANPRLYEFTSIEQFIREHSDLHIQDIYDLLVNEGRIMFTNRFENILALIYFEVWKSPEGGPADVEGDTKLMKNINEFFIRTKKEKPYADLNELLLYHERWFDQYKLELKKDKKTLEKILLIQADFEVISPLLTSPITIDHIRLSASPRFQIDPNNPEDSERIPQVIDGVDLINGAKLSVRVPFIQFNENLTSTGITDLLNSVEYSKYYTKNTLNTNVVIPQHENRKGRNTMYMTIWTGDGDPEKATIESYIRAIYNLEKNKFVIDTPITLNIDEEQLFSWIEEVLPLDFGLVTASNVISVRGYFIIYRLDINEISFFDMILNDPLLNSYLYIDERSDPIALKKRIDLHYRSYLAQTTQEKDTTSESKEVSSLSSVHCVLTQHILTDNTLADLVIDGETQQIAINAGTPYVRVKISRAISREAVDEFVNIFSHLMGYYMNGLPQIVEETNPETGEVERVLGDTYDIKTPIENLYQEFIPDDIPNVLLKDVTRSPTGRGSIASIAARLRGTTVKRGVKITPGSHYDRLAMALPDLFIPQVRRHFDKKFWPDIIDDDELEDFTNQTFEFKNKEYKRQVMEFPPPGEADESFNIGCRGDDYPFPYTKENKWINKIQYPGFPICGKTDQISKGQEYTKYYNAKRANEAEAERKSIRTDTPKSIRSSDLSSPARSSPSAASTSSYVPVTAKILEPGRLGKIPININRILKYGNRGKFRRFGVPISPNSLIHCIEVARSNKVYFDFEDKEEYVSNIRSDIVNSIDIGELHIPVLKQQLYDLTDEQILTNLQNDDEFMDPYLYYRILEEYYEINIYVFTTISLSTGILTAAAEGEGVIEIPRYKVFYARTPQPERATVCVLKTLGTKASNLSQPQCELLIDIRNNLRIFGSEMTELLDMVISKTVNTYSIIATSEFIQSFDNVNLVNLNYMVYFNTILKTKSSTTIQNLAIGQLIDSFGKLRGLVYTLEDQNIYIIIPPSDPRNLPVFSLKMIKKYPDIKLILNIFGSPSATVRNLGSIIGLWYPFNISKNPEEIKIPTILDSFYIPVNPVSNHLLDSLPIGPNDPLSLNSIGKINTVNRVRKLKRDVSIILQLLLWLYLQSGLNPYDFFNQYVYFDESPGSNSETVYDFSGIKRRLPIVKSINEALAILEPTKLVVNYGDEEGYGIFLYSKKLYEGLYYYLDLYEKTVPLSETTEKGDIISIQRILPIEIKDLFETEADFMKIPFNMIFTSEANLQAWLRFNKSDLYRRIFIKTELTNQLAELREPYLFITNQGSIYIIQNVLAENSLERALGVAQNWYDYKINSGFTTPPYIQFDVEGNRVYPPTNIYTISPDKGLILSSEIEEEIALEILLYPESDGIFAGLLKLI